MSTVKSFWYPGYEGHRDRLGIAAATSIPSTARLVTISGQLAMDPANRDKPIPTGHAAQFDLAMQNVEKALAAASPHLSREELWDGVYTVTSYHVGPLQQEDRTECFEITKKWFSIGKQNPCWTAIGVLELFVPGLLVEVQVQAAYAQ